MLDKTNLLAKIWLFLLPLVLPLYVIRFKVGPLPTTLLEVFVIVTFIVWLIVRGLTFIKRTKTTSETVSTTGMRRWVLPIVVWLLVTLFAVFIAPDKWAALGYWRAFMLEPILVFVMLADLSDKTNNKGQKTKDFLLYGMATVCILLGLYAIIQFFTGWGIPHPWDAALGRRSTGVFGFPNGLSLFLAPFGIACFIAWLKTIYAGKDWLPRLTFLSAWALSLAGEITAKSMGGILALGIGIILVLVLEKHTRKVGLILGALSLVGALLAAGYIYRTELHPLNIESNVATQKKWSSMVRTVIWQESWQVIKAHPLLGTGLRSYQTAVAPYHKATWMEIYPHPHNIILMLWIETGLMGLLTFIWLCVTWIRNLNYVQDVKDVKDVQDVTRWIWLVPLIVILIHGMVDMPYFKNDLAMQFWILAALATF